MHSFQFADAIIGFHAILIADPPCSMAYWGIALSNWGNPFAAGLKSPAQLERGFKAVEEARAASPKTRRESGYVEAVANLYTDVQKLDQQSRKLAYESAMAEVSEANPDDTEASIFYALALAAAADPADKTYAKQLKAGAILDALFVKYPNHPGLAHYIIHTYDVPALADRAALAAKAYSSIAPSTPHALHMPSHTFTRLGDWQSSIDANLASAASARSANQPPDELHATDYLVYAYLQTAQDKAALDQVQASAKIFARFDPARAMGGAASPGAAYFARAAIPARYCLERGAWAEAAKLEVLPTPFPYTDAMTHFARGLGAAHLKDRATAVAAIDALQQIHEKLIQMKDSYWAYQVEIERQEVAAWLMYAEGDEPGALAAMRTAAELEDKTEKNAVTPGPLAPARELLAELLLEEKQPAEAEKEYAATLKREPNRFRSLFGAAHAARLAGDTTPAQMYYSQLLKVAAHADQPGRPEMVEDHRAVTSAPAAVALRDLPIPSVAQSTASAIDAGRLAPIFSAYQHKDTPGCAVAVDAPGQATLTAAYGMADLEHGVSNTPDTVFEAGSVSKQFTAAAVLLLVERKQIALDDDIRKYFPEIPAYEKPITVRELLNHTSGLRDWGEVESIAGWPRTTRAYTHAHVLEIISRQHALNYPPGTAWSYTNSGYNLAAMLVERVSGTSLQAFSRKEFFEPLGMTSTQWRDDFRKIVPNRAIAYDQKGQEWRQDMPFEDIYGNGGLLTTVGDLLKWNSNLASGKLHPEIFAQMQQPSTLSDGHPINYGLGFFLETIQGLPSVDHSGATAAYRAWLGRIPSKGLSVAVLCNASTANTTDMAHQIFSPYLGPATPPEAVPQPKDPKPGLYVFVRDHGAAQVADTNGVLTFNNEPAQIKTRFAGDKMYTPSSVYGEDVWERVEPWTPQDLSAFAGNYVSDEAETTLTVVLEGGKLVIHRHPDSTFPLNPTYADAFNSDLGSIRFLRDASGKVISLSLGQARVWDLRFARIDSGAKAVSGVQ